MEVGRRGFVQAISSMLGGLFLGKVIGPVESPDATPELWKEAAPQLFTPTPFRGDRMPYLPLQLVCSETIRIVNEETASPVSRNKRSVACAADRHFSGNGYKILTTAAMADCSNHALGHLVSRRLDDACSGFFELLQKIRASARASSSGEE